MTDLDELLRAHFERDRRAELPPGSFDRLAARLEQPKTRSARPFVALAAAAVLVVGVAAFVVATRADDHQTVRSTNEPGSTVATTTTPTTPTTSPQIVTTSPVAGEGPGVFAAVVDPDGDGLGDVVLVSARTGAVLHTVYQVTGGGASGAVGIDVAPDGTVYYEACCEPAGGEIRGFDPNTGKDLGLITNGTSPAVSPDGRRLAVAAPPDPPGHIVVVDLETGQPEEHEWPLGGGGNPTSDLITDLAWSPDGATIAAEYLHYSEGAFAGVGVALLDTMTGTWTPVTKGEDGVAMPAFRADGTLLVASPAHATPDGGPIVGDSIVIWDPSTRKVEGSVGIDRVASLDASSDGRYVIAARYNALPRRVADATGVGDLGELKATKGVIAAGW